jgi:hypothetical protein
MAAGNTYEAIATQTLGSAAASVTFSSISGSYTDLVLIIEGTASAGDAVYLQYNGDTGTNYSWTNMQGTGTTTQSNRGSSTAEARIGSIGTTRYNSITQIVNYSNATTYKTAISRSNRTDVNTFAFVNLWRDTAAITSIAVITGATFSTGTTFSLYGIKAA